MFSCTRLRQPVFHRPNPQGNRSHCVPATSSVPRDCSQHPTSFLPRCRLNARSPIPRSFHRFAGQIGVRISFSPIRPSEKSMDSTMPRHTPTTNSYESFLQEVRLLNELYYANTDSTSPQQPPLLQRQPFYGNLLPVTDIRHPGSLSDPCDTPRAEAGASQMTQPTSKKAKNTFKQFIQRTTNTASSPSEANP